MNSSVEIAIYTDTEDVFGVEHNSLTQVLMNLIHMRIEVKGIIREHPGGKKSITAQNYILLDETVENE